MKRSIIFLLAVAQMCFARESHMKFISYNILQGMRLDSIPGKPSFVSWVKQQDPDVMALQEVTGFSQASLEKLATSYGHRYASLLTEGIKYQHPGFVKTVHPKAFEPKKGPDIASRIDFIFVSEDLKNSVVSARVIIDAFTDVRSDHYPVCVEIGAGR